MVCIARDLITEIHSPDRQLCAEHEIGAGQ